MKFVYHQLNTFVLELVCCKKQQKKVLDQLLVCGIGDLNDSKLIVYESK